MCVCAFIFHAFFSFDVVTDAVLLFLFPISFFVSVFRHHSENSGFCEKEESLLCPNSLILVKYDIFISVHNEKMCGFGTVQSRKKG